MATNSSEEALAAMYFYVVAGAVDNIIGVPANCWVLWLIVSGRRQLIESEILTLNLVTMELFCSISFVFATLYVKRKLMSFRFIGFFYVSASVVARVLFQCHICVDRYLAVVHPLVFVRYKQMRYRGACLAALWLVAVIVGLSNTFTTFSPVTVGMSSFGLLVPSLCAELFCSLWIVWTLRRPGPGARHSQERSEGNQQKRRAVNIICLVLVMLIFNVGPFIVLPFIDGAYEGDSFIIAFTLSSIGSSAQAFLFLSRLGKLPCRSSC